MIPGYAGKILRVNLSTKKAIAEPLNAVLVKDFIGGKGLGAKILYDEVKPGTDPLSPENKLIIATGPLTGTIFSSPGVIFIFKSPLTGFYGESIMMGAFGPELKFAGYDYLIIEGRAEKPAYLSVEDERVEVKDASGIWGKMTNEAIIEVKEDLNNPDAKVACIGPAGEKGVKFASVTAEVSRNAARCGAGVVMGSKNLKAIAIQGSGAIKYASSDTTLGLCKELLDTIMKDPIAKSYGVFGSSVTLFKQNELGILPTKNWQVGVFAGAENISAEALKKFERNSIYCPLCPIGCRKYREVIEGPFANTLTEGPGYQTMWSFGSNCGIYKLEPILKANDLCDKLGIDTISTGGVIAFATECQEKGLLTEKDSDGLKLEFGDYEVLLTLMEKIGIREGFGNVLAEGVREASRKIAHGSERFAMHVKGLEMDWGDPRGAKGAGLAFAVADRGASQSESQVYLPETVFGEWDGKKVDRFAIKGKGVLVKKMKDYTSIIDSLVTCNFISHLLQLNMIAKLASAVIGWQITSNELEKIGERISNQTRLFNLRHGARRQDDTLPWRIMNERMPKGASKGHVLNDRELNAMLDEYYISRGWNKNGVPTEDKLTELELNF